MNKNTFKKIVWNFHNKHRRSLPWRPPTLKIQKNGTLDPYKVLVSELMLQQTQVDRVIPKYIHFLKQFSSWKALAHSSLKDVLLAWQGLGYNRRALFVRQIAQKVTRDYHGKLPHETETLLAFPGIGTYTARAIRVFAYNEPEIFIETNIRTVFIHHFFSDTKTKIHDRDIIPLIEKTIDRGSPREWYYALMDYGSYLKKNHANPSRRSAHHTKQTKFEGSHRQLRARILKLITMSGPITASDIAQEIQRPHSAITKAIEELTKEKFIHEKKGRYVIM